MPVPAEAMATDPDPISEDHAAVTEPAADRDGSLPTDPSVVRGTDASGRIGSDGAAGGGSR